MLDAHCQRLGRDRGEITVSARTVCIAPTHDEAEADVARFLGERGIDLANADDARQMIDAMVTIGDPDEVGESLAEVLALGVDGLTCACPPTATILPTSSCSARSPPSSSGEPRQGCRA